MESKKLKEILALHKLWLADENTGKKADLQGAKLFGANLRGVDLRGADLEGVNLRGADLRRADLRRAKLQGANLQRAKLQGADLRGDDLDMSSGVPFHCGGTGIIGDDRLFSQMLYHLTRQDWSHCSETVKESLDHINRLATIDLFCDYRSDVCDLVIKPEISTL